jgi:N-acetylneuraminic acid mutarotase
MRYLLSIALLYICLTAQAVSDTLVWHPLSPLPAAARLGSAYFLIDSDFYAVGGDDVNQQCNKEVWRYHIPTDAWTRLHDFPYGPICETTGFAIQGKGYITTGLDSLVGMLCDTLTWEYDPINDSWHGKTSFPGSAREQASMFVFQNEAYLGLGFGCSYTLRDWWKFNPILNQWNQLDSFDGLGLHFIGSTICDSIGYVVGGESSDYPASDSLWRYDFSQDKWTYLNSIPGGPRIAPLTIGFDNFFIAGYGLLYSPFRKLMDLYKYNVLLNKWDTLVSIDLPSGSTHSATFTLGKQAYIFSSGDTVGRFVSNLWTADASGLFPREQVGIAPSIIEEQVRVRTAPDRLLVHSPDRGYIELYDPLGRLLLSQPIESGPNAIHTSDAAAGQAVCFYAVHLRSGSQTTGRVVLVRE